MINKYLIGGLVVLAIVGGAWFHGNSQGKASVHAEYQEEVTKYQQEQNKLVAELEASKAKHTQRTRERVRTVYVENDPTGCADTRAIDGVLNALGSD